MDDTISALTVGDVVTRLRQRPVLAVAPVMLGLLLSVAYVVLTPPSYVATSSVKVEPVIADRYATNINVSNLISMPTEMQVAASAEVADRAAKKLGIDPGTVRRAISVDSPQNTLVLNITYEAGSPTAAFQGAETVADSYLEYSVEAKQAVAQAQLAKVTKSIADVEAQIATRSTAGLLDQLDGLRSQKRTLDTLLSNNAGEIISHATKPTAPASPKPLVAIPAGVGLGAILGLALAVLWPARSRRRVVAPQRPSSASGQPRPGATAGRPVARPGGVPAAPPAVPPTAPPAVPAATPSDRPADQPAARPL